MDKEIKILPIERWYELREVFAREFESGLPDAKSAAILFKEDQDGNITSFIVLEMLMRAGQVYSVERSPAPLRDFVKYILQNTAAGSSVVTIASETRFGKLFKRLGMREVEGKLFRRDF